MRYTHVEQDDKGEGESSDTKERKGRRGEGTRFGDPWEGADATVDATIRFPKLRMESQYTQEKAPFAGTHNWSPTHQG